LESKGQLFGETSGVERQEGIDRRRGGLLGQRGKTLKGESQTWLQDEISLQGRKRSKPSRAWETLRAEHRWAVENPPVSRFFLLVSRKGQKTRGRLFGHCGGSDGLESMMDSEETVSAREDELELARERGTVVK